ncbi:MULTISPECIES: multidrug efflux SMR transporter [Lactobacillus]|uniref:Multidrug efflux SMR transporter n=1 Tax=Lactobacillus xujianguonis TaxID=2495899 RepID=A0A437SVU2_9LACO|nr:MULTISPECIES: multidrug efflux SMR transporter [Lactobacillus]RVU70957.1 multidrug efflux SMR transporter [Lactobacillus xujianguonis]RVU73424.1 multidrug efflux SMR transporter [Lactobacillus xujianguonis]
MGYLQLAGAIIFEIIATNLLKASNGFTKIQFTLGTIIAYIICYYLFSLSLRTIKLSLAYAIWCGLGIVATAIVSYLLWHEHISLMEIFGFALIIAGVVISNLAAK